MEFFPARLAVVALLLGKFKDFSAALCQGFINVIDS